QGFLPEQRVRPGMAITAMTQGAAYSAFGESSYGSIAIGQSANFTILNQDLWNEDDQLRNKTRVLRTIVTGQSLYAQQ
ncbi:MAG: amidohydrolase family protein, partial [Flavobacteriales bacterium]